MLLLVLVLRLLEKRWLRIPFHEQCGSDQPPAQSKLEYDYALPNTLVSHEKDVNHCGCRTTRLLLWQRSLQHWT